MALPRALRDDVRRLDQFQLRQLLILVRGRLLVSDGVPDGHVDDHMAVRVTYRREEVRCGREACTRCPHGPYWYAYWREAGRRRKLYIGGHLPGDPTPYVRPAPSSSAPDRST